MNTTTAVVQSVSPLSSAPAQESITQDLLENMVPVTEKKDSEEVEDEAHAKHNKKSHRNSIVAFVEGLVSPRTRSRSEDDGIVSMDRTTTQSSVASAKSNSSRRSSKSRPLSWIRRTSIEEQEEDAPYADVVRAQNEFMEKLRAEQQKNHITHNADGIPIPPSKPTSRRSSIVQALGLDKPLLAF
ncbi:hypothetical protein BGZ76_004318 [Entomortierella beljakovae]|nr:hypothetical protein BGZ76_004318 [Entomortierella beljakovae]